MTEKVYEQIDRLIEGRMLAARTPAMAVALIDQEKTDRLSVYGVTDIEAQTPVKFETLFEIGSISKTFTSIAVLQAHDAGIIDLHAPVTEYLPWFHVGSNYDPITTHHLLSHTAGIIAAVDSSPDALSSVWLLRNTEAAFPPGERLSYSDVGYQVLSLMLQEVMGKPFSDILKTNIFVPLKMADTEPAITHEIRPHLARGYRYLYDDRPYHTSHPLVPATWLETSSGDGCIASSIGDMAKFAHMLLNMGQGPNRSLISGASYRLLTSEIIAGEEYGYGIYTFEEDGCKHLGHGGDMPGYETILWIDLDNGLGVIFLATTPFPSGLSFPLLRLLRANRLGKPLPVIAARPDPSHIENAAEFAGTYFAGDKSVSFYAENDQLLLLHEFERIPLEKRGKDRFYVNHPDFDRYLLQFGRTDDGGNGPRVVEAFHGHDWYTNDLYTGPKDFEHPQKWNAYPGHYRSNNPWETNFRVILRKGALFLARPAGDEEPLTPLADGDFRVGKDAFSPERLRFGQIVNGKALSANLSGCDYFRFFTP